jgi:uncharacterized RDD family membrane protein YckC
VTDPAPPAAATSAATWRVLAASAYDGLLVLSLLLVVTAALHFLTHGEAISRSRVGAWQYAYGALQLVLIAVYFGIPWTRRGQTLAMKAWRLRLERRDGSLPDWNAVLRRLAVAVPLYVLALAGTLAYKAHLAGLAAAFACALPVIASHAWQAASGRGTLPDRASGTHLVALARDA